MFNTAVFPAWVKGVHFTHNHYRSLFELLLSDRCSHGRPCVQGARLDVSLGWGCRSAHLEKNPTKTVGNSRVSLLEKNPTKCTLKLCLAMSDELKLPGD